MNVATQLQPIQSVSWKRGFDILLNKEFALWFNTSRWWKQIIIWVVSINLLVFLTTIGTQPDAEMLNETVMLFGIFTTLWTSFGAIIIISGTIVNEKKDGSAAWLLSKPVSRTSYLLTKYIANGFSMLLILVTIPSVLFYIHMGLWSGIWLSFSGLLLVITLLSVNVLVWAALSFLMGTFFSSNAAVTGSSIGILSAIMMVGQNVPGAEYIFSIFIGIPLVDESAVQILMNGELSSQLFTGVIGIVFVVFMMLVALRRFYKQEL